MSRRPAIASAPVGERTPARERAEEAIRTAAAAALACLRAGDVAGAESEALLYVPPPFYGRRSGLELVRYDAQTGEVQRYETDADDEADQ